MFAVVGYQAVVYDAFVLFIFYIYNFLIFVHMHQLTFYILFFVFSDKTYNQIYIQIYVCRNILIQLCVNLLACHTNYQLVNRVI